MKAFLEPTRTEVSALLRGRPSYQWVDAFFVYTPDGKKLYPPMRPAEALAFCKAQGWEVERGERRRCPGCGALEFIPAELVTCRDCAKIPGPEPTPDHIKYSENPPL